MNCSDWFYYIKLIWPTVKFFHSFFSVFFSQPKAVWLFEFSSIQFNGQFMIIENQVLHRRFQCFALQNVVFSSESLGFCMCVCVCLFLLYFQYLFGGFPITFNSKAQIVFLSRPMRTLHEIYGRYKTQFISWNNWNGQK